MLQKRFRSKVALSLVVGIPLATLGIAQVASGAVKGELFARNGIAISSQLSANDRLTLNGVEYAAGPAYSPRKSCGACHDYDQITRAYHFTQGTLPGAVGSGMGVSDTWSSENQDGNTAYKYLANAYGHLLSGGQYGAW